MNVYIDEGIDVNYSEKLIRKIMKNDLNLSFKQRNSRPLAFNVAKASQNQF